MTDRPTHKLKSTGDIVFPSGEDSADIEPLPANYWAAIDKAQAIEAIKAEAQRRILEKYPLEKQVNAPFEPDATWVIEMREFIDGVRAWSNAEEAKLG